MVKEPYEKYLTKYHKAVRDKIPEIIKESGKSCTVKTISDEEFLAELEKKLGEELKEYLDSKATEELVDIMEVVYRIADLRGTDTDSLEKARIEKNKMRGAFENNLFLIDVQD